MKISKMGRALECSPTEFTTPEILRKGPGNMIRRAPVELIEDQLYDMYYREEYKKKRGSNGQQ
jgi:hypothetical protein